MRLPALRQLPSGCHTTLRPASRLSSRLYATDNSPPGTGSGTPQKDTPSDKPPPPTAEEKHGTPNTPGDEHPAKQPDPQVEPKSSTGIETKGPGGTVAGGKD